MLMLRPHLLPPCHHHPTTRTSSHHHLHPPYPNHHHPQPAQQLRQAPLQLDLVSFSAAVWLHSLHHPTHRSHLPLPALQQHCVIDPTCTATPTLLLTSPRCHPSLVLQAPLNL